MSSSLDPDQARDFVGPDLGPNFLQSLSADDTSRLRVYFFWGIDKYHIQLRPIDKSVQLKINILISHPKHTLWVLGKYNLNDTNG